MHVREEGWSRRLVLLSPVCKEATVARRTCRQAGPFLSALGRQPAPQNPILITDRIRPQHGDRIRPQVGDVRWLYIKHWQRVLLYGTAHFSNERETPKRTTITPRPIASWRRADQEKKEIDGGVDDDAPGGEVVEEEAARVRRRGARGKASQAQLLGGPGLRS